MIIRCIEEGTARVCGAVEHDGFSPFASIFRFSAPDWGTTALLLGPWFIDEENRPISALVCDGRAQSPYPSARLEYFIIVPAELFGKLPGWVRQPPKPIIERPSV